MEQNNTNSQGNLFSSQTFAALELDDTQPFSSDSIGESGKLDEELPPLPEYRAPAPAPERAPAPKAAPPAAKPAPAPKKVSGSGWMTAFKVFAWILFAVIIAGGTGFGVWQAMELYTNLLELDSLLMIGGFAGGSLLLALLEISGVMVWLNLARNVAFIRGEIDAQLRG